MKNLFGEETYSKSLYRSLLVKAVRIGWTAGAEEAIRHLSKSDSTSILITQLFEDTLPRWTESP